jgi:WD40 repeat protein
MNIFIPRIKLIFTLIIISSLFACDSSDKAEKTFSFKKEGLYSASLSENYALIAPLAGFAELWQLKPTKLMHKWQHTDDSTGVIATAISADEQYAVTAERNSIAWWRISDGTLLSVWSLPNIYSVTLSSDGQHALVGLEEKAIYLSLARGTTRFAFPHDDLVTEVALSRSGAYAATGSKDKLAKLWDLSSGKLLHQWPHHNEISALAFSHNEKYLLTNAALARTRLWKLPSGKLFKQLPPERLTLMSATFSNNDKYLLTGWVASRIDLWSVKKGQRKKFWRTKKNENWRPAAASVLALHFTKRDKKFYSISSNGFLQRWRR